MSKRKGVSAEEKRTRMLQLFYEKKEFFQLKELERIAPKEKGIIAQSVKDVVQSLVDDGLVDTDKIGTSVYFWAYPNKAHASRKRQFEELSQNLETANKKLKKSKEDLEAYKEADEDAEEKSKIMAELIELRVKKENLVAELQKLKDNDPDVLESLKKSTQNIKDAANRWTDNIFAIKQWCKNKFMIEDNELNKQFGISPELDYIY